MSFKHPGDWMCQVTPGGVVVSEQSPSRVFPDLLWFAILALWAELWEQQGGKEEESAQI